MIEVVRTIIVITMLLPTLLMVSYLELTIFFLALCHYLSKLTTSIHNIKYKISFHVHLISMVNLQVNLEVFFNL